MSKVQDLRKQGFDLSVYDRHVGYWRVRCSQCEAMVIQGVPCHEAGCPNARRDDELHTEG